MKETKIYQKEKITLRNPIMIVGLPGIGNVGSLVGEHLKRELNATRFATLYSPHFPHQVFMLKSGGVRLLSNRFYYWRNPSKEKGARDLVVLTGDSQAISTEGQYDVNAKIVEFFKKLGGKTIYTVGGYSPSNQYVHTPRVFAVSNNKEMIKKLKADGALLGKAYGMIFGSAGLIVGLAKKYNVEASCVMGETGLLEVDANSAKAVLNFFIKHLSLNVNLENIEKIRKETEKMLLELDEATRSASQPPSKENLTYIR